MDLDVRNCERQRSKQDVDLVSEKDRVGVDKEENDESNSLLSPHGGGMAKRERSSRRKVKWIDKNGDNLFEVLEFQPSHSYGEFVFDHSWADAYYSYGSQYYPKLQCCVPFTPVTSQRILLRDTWYKDQVFFKILEAMKDLTAKVSSLYVTFPSENEWHKMKEAGFLQRIGMQYHWKNRNYKNFDEFLMDMKQSKRKNIRQERKKVEQREHKRANGGGTSKS